MNFNFTKALLIGINYIGTPYTLRGCHNDVDNIKLLLMSKGMKETNITIMKEPKRIDILRGFVKFVMDAEENDNLYFHFSGHGMQIDNTGNDIETDGKDEVIISADLKSIKDDEINRYLIGCLPNNVNLFSVFDCCHSGTMLDLKYTITTSQESDDFIIKKENTKECDPKEGKIIALSGSLDSQVSIDAYIKNSYQGALTYCFIETLNEENMIMDFLDILKKINEKLIKYGFINQQPILSTNKI